jgi:uncharacterized protein (TIGR03437 family)
LGNATLQVVRGGTPGNTISVNIVAMAPAILPFSGTTYAVAQTAQGGYEGYPPAFPAAHAGDVLVLYAVGLGATAPAATAGQASPGAPGLANVTPTPQVCFGGANVVTAADTVCVTPFFAGLTPGYFGLYQINFVVPDLPAELKGNAVPISVTVGNSRSNLLHLAIQ